MRSLALLLVLVFSTIQLKADVAVDTMRHKPMQIEIVRLGNILGSDDHGQGITLGSEANYFIKPIFSINLGFHFILFSGGDGLVGGSFTSLKSEVYTSSNDKSRFFVGAGVYSTFEKFPSYGFVARVGYQFSFVRIGAELFTPQLGDGYIERNQFYMLFLSFAIRDKIDKRD